MWCDVTVFARRPRMAFPGLPCVVHLSLQFWWHFSCSGAAGAAGANLSVFPCLFVWSYSVQQYQ